MSLSNRKIWQIILGLCLTRPIPNRANFRVKIGNMRAVPHPLRGWQSYGAVRKLERKVVLNTRIDE